MFVVLNIFAFLNTLAFVLEDEYLAGIEMMLKSPNAVGTLIFTGLFLMLKTFLRLIWQLFISKSKECVKRYQIIEDRLTMEEYEDPK